MAYEHILVDTEDGVGIVTLNRPDSGVSNHCPCSSTLAENAVITTVPPPLTYSLIAFALAVSMT